MPEGDTSKITLLLEAEGDQFRIRAEASGGEAKGEGPLPNKDTLAEIADYNPANLPKGVQARIGRALWDAITVGTVNELMFDTLQDAGEQKEVVQVELRFDPDQVKLTSYPWEMICNPNGQFLVRDGLIDMTRYITYPQNPPRFDAKLADLPLLRIISSPPSLKPITALPLTVANIVQLTPATFDEFMKRLLLERKTLWALEFDGHGALVKICPQCETANDLTSLACYKCRTSLQDAKTAGALAFEDPSGVRWISTSEFGSMLYNANIPLALLLACESAMTGGDLVFNGVAPGLLLAGVPAVIGMQYEVSDQFANNFSNIFYDMLDSGRSLLESLRLARRMNIGEAWYSPVLYLRYRRTAAEERQLPPITEARKIDTAVPSKVTAGVDFLARLWIRRPDTKALSRAELADMLGTKDDVNISVRDDQDVEVELKQVQGRKLRRGEVQVKLQSPKCTITPESITLFVDEQIDAPPAFFTVRAMQTGKIALIFTVLQDGAQISTIVHTIDAVEQQNQAVGAVLQNASSTVPVGNDALAGGLPPPAKPGRTPTGQGAAGPRAEPPPPPAEDTGPETEVMDREEAVAADREATKEEAAPPASAASGSEPEPTKIEAPPDDARPSDILVPPGVQDIPADETSLEMAPPTMVAGDTPELDATVERQYNPDETVQHPSAVPPPPPISQPPLGTPAGSVAPPPPPGGYGSSSGGGPGAAPSEAYYPPPADRGGYDYGAVPADKPSSYPSPSQAQYQPPTAAPSAPRKRSPIPAVAGAVGALAMVAAAGVLAIGAMGPVLSAAFGGNKTPIAGITATAPIEITEIVQATTSPVGPTTVPVDPVALAAQTAVRSFDDVRQNGLQTGDAEKVDQVADGGAQRVLYDEIAQIQHSGCGWSFDDHGLKIQDVTVNDPQHVTVTATGDRTGSLNCDGKVADQITAPPQYTYVVSLINDRWVVTQFTEKR